MAPTTVLITGANRGLGKGILERYAARENHIVIAANRDPGHPTSQALKDLPTGPGSRIIVVKIDATVESDAAAAVQELVSTHGIDHLDVVIGNAGIAKVFPKISELKTSDLLEHVVPNVCALIWLFQATLSLLKKSANPKFVTLGSASALLGNMLPVGNGVYGPTKIAAAWYTAKINQEEEWLTSFIIHPGWVNTDMGTGGAQAWGVPEGPPDDFNESCNGMVRVIDASAKKSHGGLIWSFRGERVDW
ncbi:hypothetical protein M426DRAFT_318118 [Hypoxylon sp. CI-4A]|nr:hypothetical protein M426DRAFT_318118 [Hypoxylon sp. CI-4A]